VQQDRDEQNGPAGALSKASAPVSTISTARVVVTRLDLRRAKPPSSERPSR
jgi:hypothetical protein